MVVPAILTHNSFEYFLNQLPPEDKLRKSPIVLDLSLVSSVTPYTVSCFLILCRYLENKKVEYTIDFSSNIAALSQFRCWRFFQYLKQEEIDNPGKRDTEEREGGEEILLPLSSIDDEKDIYNLLGYLRENLEVSGESTTDLFVAVSEIAQNIIEHSKGKGFVVMGKKYQRSGGKHAIDISVVDDGVGIGKTLEDKLTSLERAYRDGAAIYKALFEGISRYDDVGRGYGIVKTRELVEKYKGKMLIRSGQAKLWGKIPSWEIERFLQKKLRYLPGTQINIIFPL